MGSLYTSPQIPWWEGDARSPPHEPSPRCRSRGPRSLALPAETTPTVIFFLKNRARDTG